jgi:hypothetical protein
MDKRVRGPWPRTEVLNVTEYRKLFDLTGKTAVVLVRPPRAAELA